MMRYFFLALFLGILGISCGGNSVSSNSKTSEVVPETADEVGKMLSHQACVGTAKPPLTHLPMKLEDFDSIIPYGLMVGGHVTPIDHQYFSPTIFDSKPDTYPVYAMADSQLVDIQTRTHPGQGSYKNLIIMDHRLVFSLSCRLFYYYDLVTSLRPDLREKFETGGKNLSVKAGELIGYIGNQTLDFAVWDTEIILPGFIIPSHYERERWKIHTADPLNYYTEGIKTQVLGKYIRTVEPRSGKIDYDIDGRLIGNWFQENPDGSTYGYAGNGGQEYWNTHLAFAPHHVDPLRFIISIGNWTGPYGASQFSAQAGAPNPAQISVDTGLVIYSLQQFGETQVQGCMLVQMLEARKIKVETRVGKSCNKTEEFSGSVLYYVR